MKKDLKHTLDDFLNRDMDRKEFLAHIGAGVLAIVGVSNLTKLLGKDQQVVSEGRKQGFGSGPYGGNKEEV